MIERNFIIHQHARQYQWSGECFLSVKSFYSGVARYHIQQRNYAVNDNNYLILNDCTKYNLVIDHATPTESFCVFFSPDFVCQNASASCATVGQLLDLSFEKTNGIKLLERNYLHGDPVSKTLLDGRRLSIENKSEIEKEEFYITLFNAILSQNNDSLKDADRLALKKKSTREEIYRRLLYAKDFIDCNYSENLSLKKISQVAMLSENHLLRNFNRIFKTSPFQYITQLKIAEAKRQIIETDQSITDISLNLGYLSLTNFSYFFKKVVGVYPVELRKK
ncbi:MAG TPA: AraC family transcriptional regulator [Chryseolinea sp.]